MWNLAQLSRGLSPTGNVFLARDFEVRLGDFGVCKEKDHTADLASTMIGTPLYFSPEICQNHKYQEPADVWGLGCILYETVVGHAPFASNGPSTPAAILVKIVHEHLKPDALVTNMRRLRAVRACLEACLKKRPSERPSAKHVRDVFAKAIREERKTSKFTPELRDAAGKVDTIVPWRQCSKYLRRVGCRQPRMLLVEAAGGCSRPRNRSQSRIAHSLQRHQKSMERHHPNHIFRPFERRLSLRRQGQNKERLKLCFMASKALSSLRSNWRSRVEVMCRLADLDMAIH